MGGGDGADDGQAEAVAAVAAGGARAEPLEGLEQAVDSETAWNTPGLPPQPGASGGGFSHLFARPGYQAGPGWDPVTGWGTPDAQVLVPCWPTYMLRILSM